MEPRISIVTLGVSNYPRATSACKQRSRHCVQVMGAPWLSSWVAALTLMIWNDSELEPKTRKWPHRNFFALSNLSVSAEPHTASRNLLLPSRGLRENVRDVRWLCAAMWVYSSRIGYSWMWMRLPSLAENSQTIRAPN
jgi:hypothetical protein